MKTGYVYLVSLRSRFGRVVRLATSLRHPAERVAKLKEGSFRQRGVRLLAYAFVEDMIGARAEVRASLRRWRIAGHARTFWVLPPMAKTALQRAAQRQSSFRRARFDPVSGLLTDREVELAGPITGFTDMLATVIARESWPDRAHLNLLLHPYMVGLLAGIFRHSQPDTKIPDEYWPEILKEITWRTTRSRLKAPFFVRMSRQTAREMSYSALAHQGLMLAYEKTGRSAAVPTGRTPPGSPRLAAPLIAYLRAPEAHLRQVMERYGDELETALPSRLRRIGYRVLRFLLAVVFVVLLDTLLTAGGAEAMLRALLFAFLAGATVLAFNLYELPDTTRGLGVFSMREIKRELARLTPRSA